MSLDQFRQLAEQRIEDLSREVARRKHAEEILRASERRFRAIVEHGRDSLALISADGVFRYVNPATTHILGYSAEEMVGHSIFQFIHAEEREMLAQLLQQLLRQPNGSITTLLRYRHRNGSWQLFAGTNTNLLDDPSVQAIVANWRDVTEQREVEQARSQLAAIVESSPDAIIGRNLEGDVTSWNAGAERFYGYSAAEMLGRPISLLLPPNCPNELPEISERLRRGEGIEPYETVCKRKDGSLVQVSVGISPIKDASGNLVGSSAITREVTAQKRLEAELQQRVIDLAEAHRHKDEFLNMLAHELRNPLAPILNALHILRLTGLDGTSHIRARSIMERQVRHLARLGEDLLEMCRLARGQLPLRRERVDVARLVRHTTEDRRTITEQAGLSLTVTAPDTPVWVIGDATRLTQALDNLIDNAIRFTDKGGDLSVAMRIETESRQVVITVRDTGAGIDAALLPRLFEPFRQADRSLHRSKGGLGLGLALVKGLVELHGGTVHVASAGEGHGAEFIVHLPLASELAALTAAEAPARAARKPLRIAIVEDNRDAAESMRFLLTVLGHEVRLAYSGPEGVSLAKQWTPDVVLCDIGLPGLDGFGVAEALRRDPATAKVWLIAITGYGSDDDRRRSREAGFDLHLTKPVDPADLQPLLIRRPGLM